ncbi:MAG: hypothetical protein D8M59_02015 [Planctomycetes bacterium]|nr:hypothetical protein [Planctomycetota bacterium]NOG54504.1 hypothetical protein [Planctomycetota bacterium]
MKAFTADLRLSKIEPIDQAGRRVDFHSLRMTFSTMLAANRVSQREAPALMRRRDPRLTANVYTDERVLPLAAVLRGCPTFPTQTHRHPNRSR